ncbi:ABC transporter substrate-binding protein [Faecalibacterium prausnitzii]|uniref:ABC transporter substrate-binding protein n=2 Tax=Faecalibacterium prausnitzii TaxID=853 RepID=A0A329U6Y4_9FIRM|nr:ABC transporter substrate-binding protein [Faecalibacterium prausnitzii]
MHHAFSRRQFLKAGGAAALSTAAAGLLSSCGGSSAGGTAATGDSTTYTVLYARQPASLNYLICSADPDLYHGTHCVDTLVEYDSRGKIREGLATSWEWDADTLTWTFHLRDENWVDYTGAVLGPVTAQDFVDALAYLLDPDYASGTASLVTPYVAGAEDYYNYCVWRNNANNGTVAEDGTTYTIDAAGTVTLTAADGSTTTCPAVDFSSVGVAAVDEHTLTYTLNYDFPGFLSLLNYAPFEPAYGPMLAELGDQFCTSAETACNCGAFYLAEYTPLESWVMKKNPENYDKDNVYIDTIRYIYNQEALISGPEMVRRGEIDQATISSDILDSWLADDTTKDMVSMERPETGKSYFYFFNFLPYAHQFPNWNTTGVDAQYQPDNWAKAVNSTNFRKAFLYAINPAVTLAVTAPEGYENYKLHTITPPSFCADSKGVDYTECGALANVTDHFNEATAKQYRDAAVQELTAAGATFPIKVQYPYNPAVVDWDKQCQVFKQQVEGVLNDGFDFVEIIITQGPSDNFLNAVRRAGAYEFMSYYWGADYSDPETEVYPFYQEAGDRGTCYAFLRTGVEDGIITGETAGYVMTYMDMVEKAKAITADLDARYAAFAEAEAYLIENALVIPLSLPVPPYIATRLNLWEGQYAPTGFSSNRLKGIHILDHYVSMDEYNHNRDAR